MICCSRLRFVFISLLAFSSAATAQSVTGTLTAGTAPYAVGVNPVTNKIYVVNNSSNNVTVIDGATNATATVAVGTRPLAVAVNPVTNNIYVANFNSNNVTIINGTTNATATVAVGTSPNSIAVNPVTNKIYVANSGSNDVTIIDGASNSTAAVGAGTNPVAVAVNPVTNKVYVTNYNSNNVTVIDGTTNSAIQLAVGTHPAVVAVNPVTNKAYVANYDSNSVTVIDGTTNATSTVAAGTNPNTIAVTPVTNKIYVANVNSNNVTVIDGATNVTSTVAAGSQPYSIVVNSTSNKIYVTNVNSNNLTVIDGITNSTVTMAVGTYPYAIGVNPVTDKIYVGNLQSNNVTLIDGATNSTSTIVVLPTPVDIAINPITNKIYVANYNGYCTVIDGATNAIVTLAAGSTPVVAIAVNIVTNKIYLINQNNSNVTVVDGATNSTSTVPVGSTPIVLAVNPVTNKVYVANYTSSSVTVIDGATNSTSTVSVGAFPNSLAVNQVTNRVYVSSLTTNHVTVIDAATGATATVAVGTSPRNIAVNTVTNKVYVSNYGSNNVTVIDGATNATTTVLAGTSPRGLAVNSFTNKIYVANQDSNNVTVIDGSTNSTNTVAVGTQPFVTALNRVTNKVYVSNYGSNDVTVIDGATNVATSVPTGNHPFSVAVNPATNNIYVGNQSDSINTSVTVLTEQQVQVVPLGTTITPFINNTTVERTPTFMFTTNSTFSPTAPVVQDVYFQLDTWQGKWLRAQGAFNAFTGSAPTLSLGTHIVYAYATDGQDAGSTQTSTGNGGQSSPLIGTIQAYVFTVMQAPTTTMLTADVNPLVSNAAVTFTASVSVNAPGSGAATGTVAFRDSGVSILGGAAVPVDGTGHAIFQTTGLGIGSHSITAVYSGDADSIGSTSPILFEVVIASTTTSITNAPAVTYGTAGSVTLKVSSVSTPTGNVSLSVDGGEAASVLLDGNGNAVFNVGILPAGNHALSANYSAQGNFPASSTSGSLMVNKANIAITGNSASRLYGAANPSFSGTVGTTVNGDVITATFTSPATPTSNIGTYNIVPTPAGAALANYAVTLVNGTLTVNQATLTVTGSDASRFYGAANPAFTGTVGATQNSDVITATYATAATPASSIGTYNIVPAPAGAALANYNVTLVNGTLTVDQTALTIAGNNAARNYGAVNPALSGIVTGVQNGDVITATYATSATPASSVGTYAIVPTPAGAALANYNVTLVNGALSVNPAPLTLTAGGASRSYGAANPSVGVAVVGIQNGDAITASQTASAIATSPVGTYAIVPSASGAAIANYSVTANNGTLTVTQAPTFTAVGFAGGPILVGGGVISSTAGFSFAGSVTAFTAKVFSTTSGTPTGNVTFMDGSTIVGTGTIDPFGSAAFSTSTLAVGSHSITAVYAGDVNFAGSTSAVFNLTVSAASAATLSSSALTFGNQFPGTFSNVQSVTVTNTGGSTLIINSIETMGDFFETTNCTSLQAGASCTIRVAFSPSQLGATTGVLTIISNAPSHIQSIPLSGTGTDISIAFGRPSRPSRSAANTIVAGQSARMELNLITTNSASGKVALTCSGAPAGASCSVFPPIADLSGSGTPITVIVITTARVPQRAARLSAFDHSSNAGTPAGNYSLHVIASTPKTSGRTDLPISIK